MNGFKNINDAVANKKLFVKISEIADKIMQEEFSLMETEKVPLIDHSNSTTIMTTGWNRWIVSFLHLKLAMCI